MPPTSHAWVVPEGEAMVTLVEAELMPTQPVSIAAVDVVVTPGTVAEIAAAPAVLEALPSIGVVGSTPEYRAMPAPFATVLDKVHVRALGSDGPTTWR